MFHQNAAARLGSLTLCMGLYACLYGLRDGQHHVVANSMYSKHIRRSETSGFDEAILVDGALTRPRR